MKIKNQLTIGRLIGKIDNDFNLSESDWIPRVAAWVIDALSQMKVLPMDYKTRELEVSERIAQYPCEIKGSDIYVYDKNGCEILPLNSTNDCGCINSNNSNRTDSGDKFINPREIAIIDDDNRTGINFMSVVKAYSGSANRNFVLNGNQIDLNFDTDKITVKTLEPVTYYDDYFDEEVPYIYDDGLLLEALAWYCLFKYLSRGSKHPVFDLKSNSPVTNPWIQWNGIRPKAMASVKSKIAKDTNGWNNFFYNSTFRPRG